MKMRRITMTLKSKTETKITIVHKDKHGNIKYSEEKMTDGNTNKCR